MLSLFRMVKSRDLKGDISLLFEVFALFEIPLGSSSTMLYANA